MPRLLFNLQNVPEEEADEVRALLSEQEIRFYETQAGRWRLGLAAIWLADNSQEEQAKDLLERYQQQRIHNANDERKRLKELGYVNAFLENIYSKPLTVVGALVGIIIVLLVSILPFIDR